MSSCFMVLSIRSCGSWSSNLALPGVSGTDPIDVPSCPLCRMVNGGAGTGRVENGTESEDGFRKRCDPAWEDVVDRLRDEVEVMDGRNDASEWSFWYT